MPRRTKVRSDKHLVKVNSKAKDDGGPCSDGDVQAKADEVENVLHAGPTRKAVARSARRGCGLWLSRALLLSRLLCLLHGLTRVVREDVSLYVRVVGQRAETGRGEAAAGQEPRGPPVRTVNAFLLSATPCHIQFVSHEIPRMPCALARGERVPASLCNLAVLQVRAGCVTYTFRPFR